MAKRTVDLITINGFGYVQTGNADLGQAVNGALIRHQMIGCRPCGEYEITARRVPLEGTIKELRQKLGDPEKIERGVCANNCVPEVYSTYLKANFQPQQNIARGDYVCIACRDKERLGD